MTIINLRVNYFEAARMIQTKKRSTTGFDKGPFILSLKRTNKTIRKALKIISLHFLILLRRNSKRKEVLLTGDCIKSYVFFKNFFSKYEQIHRYPQVRYLYSKMLEYGSWNCIYLWGSFFLFSFLMFLSLIQLFIEIILSRHSEK